MAIRKGFRVADQQLDRLLEELVRQANKAGSPGADGAAGADGAPGAPGADGVDGVDGADGTSINAIWGTAAPSNGDGQPDGTIYVQVSA
jgi:hypothetical protein